MYDVRLTPKALKQLDVWPADNERGLYLLRGIADAFDGVAADVEATEGDKSDQAGRLRQAAQSVRAVILEAGTEIVAKVISSVVTDG